MWFCLDWTSPPFVDLFVSAPGRPRMWFCDILCIYLALQLTCLSINSIMPPICAPLFRWMSLLEPKPIHDWIREIKQVVLACHFRTWACPGFHIGWRERSQEFPIFTNIYSDKWWKLNQANESMILDVALSGNEVHRAPLNPLVCDHCHLPWGVIAPSHGPKYKL